jgi:hypothetical protein
MGNNLFSPVTRFLPAVYIYRMQVPGKEADMKKILPTLLLIALLTSCRTSQLPETPAATTTSLAVEPSPKEGQSAWSIFDPDPDHPWNRVFRQLYQRTTTDGEEYGADELDPLLWFDTTYLLTGDSHQQVVRVLDEFLSNNADNLIQPPLKRAMFQRDLWAVFDWLVSQAEPYPAAREALAVRLVEIMKRIALSREEILSLPDNYRLAVSSGLYPTAFQGDHPEEIFLPPDLFQPDSAWVPIGREGGPAAMTHTEAFPFFGRSVFLVFYRSPDGRRATLDFIDALNTEPSRALTMGLDVALVRRMLLIDDEGNLVLSPMVEMIQIRHFNPAQSFYEFELDRSRLFDGVAGGLVPNHELFMLFMSHGDVFEIPDLPFLKATIPEICKACHFENPPLPNPANTQSIISYSRHPFSLTDNSRPILFAATLEGETQSVIEWKQDHETWKALETLWERTLP